MIEGLLSWLSAQLHAGALASGAALGLAGGAAGGIVAAIHRLIPRLWHVISDAVTTSISVDARSAAFEPLILWLNAHPYAARCRRLTVSTRDADDKRLLFTPAPGTHWFFYGGLPIRLDRSAPSRKGTVAEGGANAPETIILHALGRDRRQLRYLIEDAMAQHGGRDPDWMMVHGIGEYGDWERSARIRRRPLGSVVTKGRVAERLVEDVSRFLASGDWHVARGIPWRRGYLLYGPPGTGKTSLVKALAGTLDLDVAVINLASPRLDDSSLVDLLSDAPKRSILLLEDIDAAFRGREREEANGKLTFSGLLNALDGVASQEGRPLFMTTNHIEKLDPALIRPGRIDVRIEVGLADKSMARQLFLVFFPGADGLADRFADTIAEGLAPAELQAHLLAHRDNAQSAVSSLESPESRPDWHEAAGDGQTHAKAVEPPRLDA
jgi:chaperone BCS1